MKIGIFLISSPLKNPVVLCFPLIPSNKATGLGIKPLFAFISFELFDFGGTYNCPNNGNGGNVNICALMFRLEEIELLELLEEELLELLEELELDELLLELLEELGELE